MSASCEQPRQLRSLPRFRHLPVARASASVACALPAWAGARGRRARCRTGPGTSAVLTEALPAARTLDGAGLCAAFAFPFRPWPHSCASSSCAQLGFCMRTCRNGPKHFSGAFTFLWPSSSSSGNAWFALPCPGGSVSFGLRSTLSAGVGPSPPRFPSRRCGSRTGRPQLGTGVRDIGDVVVVASKNAPHGKPKNKGNPAVSRQCPVCAGCSSIQTSSVSNQVLLWIHHLSHESAHRSQLRTYTHIYRVVPISCLCLSCSLSTYVCTYNDTYYCKSYTWVTRKSSSGLHNATCQCLRRC